MMRSIYTKTFLWFWLALIGVTASVTLLTVLSGSQPLARPWVELSMNASARGAVELYQQNGKEALARYVDELENSSSMRAALLDPQGRDILGRGLPNIRMDLLQQVRDTGRSQFLMSTYWSSVTVVPSAEGNYVFAAEVHPLRRFWRQRAVGSFALKFLIAMLAAGLLCLIPTRHIANPIRALQAAARRIADGDFSVRATPAIAPRADELADLAHDFDRMAERIESLLRKQQQLLGDISHDLRSPLTRLSVSLELVKRGDTEAIGRMEQELQRLDAMIAQILTLTRLQASDGQRLATRVDLRALVERIVADANFEGEEQDKGVVLRQADNCCVQGDPSLLHSCIENVVRNAVRYTKAGTKVELSLSVSTGVHPVATLIVADCGEGVPPDSLSRLFEPFYRVSPARDAVSGGFGLGLAIAQRVAHLHGGTVSARNRHEGGLEVIIQFPAQAAAPSVPATE